MAKAKGGLGRGLGALIPTYDEMEKNGIEPTQVSILEIYPNPDQPRKDFDEDDLADLTESIKEHGVIQPLIVCKKEKGYMIVAGERRYRAATRAGLQELPVLVKSFTDEQILEIALIENVQRKDLNVIEEARGYKMLTDRFGYTADQLAKRMGKSRPQIANTMRLLQLPDEVLRFVEEKKLTAGHVRPLLALNHASWQIETAMDIYEQGLSVRQVEAIVNELVSDGAIKKDEDSNENGNKREKQVLSLEMKAIEEQLKERLGTKIRIKPKGKGGKIEIEFYSDEDLKRVIDAFGGDFY